jgi:hypothetical protein
MSTSNPFSALDRGERRRGVGGGEAADETSSATATGGSTTKKRRSKKRSQTQTQARTLEANEREAARARAHAAMERAMMEEDVDDVSVWGRVRRGNGLAKSQAKQMAKERLAAEGRRRTTREGATNAGVDVVDVAGREPSSESSRDAANGVDEGKSRTEFEPKVSEVFHHTFSDAGASCWCVDVEDEYGETTTMSITKAVPRVRKLVNERDGRPVLADEEMRAVVEHWNETTRIDRARKAKALRKQAEAEAKARARAEAEASKTIADIGLPEILVSSEATVRTTTPPPGFGGVASTTKAPPPGFARGTPRAPPPGFEAPAYHSVVHVPVMDPSIEARQRELEAQVATLQAQLAAQQLRELERRRVPEATGNVYVPPPRRDSIW